MIEGSLHLGVDVGTQGVRAVVVRSDGEVVARGHRALAPLPTGPVQEQRADELWDGLVGSIADLGPHRDDVTSLAISCTSGSLCAIDAAGDPLGPVLLYSDQRAITTPDDDASWAVAKLRWLVDAQPALVARAACFTTPAGFLAGRLLGAQAAIDETQALKLGYDVHARAWGAMPVDEARLPAVVPSGSGMGSVAIAAAAATGLPEGTSVVAGATDGIAAQMACRPSAERWVVTIGSTIVWKTMTEARIACAHHGIYSHRGPDGWWFPGAASNAGGRAFAGWATDEELARCADTAVISPTTTPAYPSVVRGERFPFEDPAFAPWPASAHEGPERYAAEALGMAFVERWGRDVLVEHGCATPAVVATTGGAGASPRLARLRAEVLGVPIEVPAEPTTAFGAAVIAAAPIHGGVLAAADAMVHTGERYEPSGATDDWTDPFDAFRVECDRHRRGAA